MTNSYSNLLQNKTREMLMDEVITYDLQYHLKHQEHGYAVLDFMDLRDRRIELKGITEEQIFKYDDIEGMIAAGWVID